MNRTLSKKLIYVIAAVTLLALLIPAMAVPVSAAPVLTMTLVNPLTGDATTLDSGYNVTGSTVRVTITGLDGLTVTSWNHIDQTPVGANSVITGNGTNYVDITGVYGETQISANLSNGTTTAPVNKKWGHIQSTDISIPGSSYVTWNEGTKSWTGNATIIDTVMGVYPATTHLAQGVILNWYLIKASETVPGPGEAVNHDVPTAGLKYIMEHKSPAIFARIVGTNPLSTMYSNVTGADGTARIDIVTTGEEAIKIVVIPEYPGDPQLDVTPEVTSWNFQTREMEVVPQVRWAGEKIVLEKNFGTVFHNANVQQRPLYLVRFASTTPNAILETFGNTYIPLGGGNFSNTPQSVWTTVDDNGLASVVLYYANQGQVDVAATLYEYWSGNDQLMQIGNQHAFTVYYMKLESLTLGDVVGKRAAHNAGRWTPANPYNTAFTSGNATNPNPSDLSVQTLNVSQDALERAQVKGWFMGANWSTRGQGYQDQDGNGVNDITLPANRWVLPDDWATLAGYYNWQQRRIHWDIMDAPSDLVTSTSPLGPYITGQYTPVQGPFSPGIELMTNTGWEKGATSPDSTRYMKSVVPNSVLDAWDAPMPPAKIIFEITEGAGYFKTAYKSDIYYLMDGQTVRYTAPFYQSLIPAHQAIPAFVNNGGYDWASFDTVHYGPYVFWTIINRPDAQAKVPTTDWANRPTKVEVYSDNHGEAMVYLNGDWNLNLTNWNINGAYDVQPGAVVATSKVQAMADYPYFRDHQPIASTKVEKIWTWGKYILGANPQIDAGYNNGTKDPATYRMVLQTGALNLDPLDAQGNHINAGRAYDDYLATSEKKMAWIWVSDRDGLRDGALGWTIEWFIQAQGTTGIIIPPVTSFVDEHGNKLGISTFNDITKHIYLADGFLEGTSGHVTNTARTAGASVTRAPTDWEAQLFTKYYSGLGLEAKNFAVAAVEVQCASQTQVDLSIYIHSPREGTILRNTNLDFRAADRADDPIVLGDANFDGNVNMGDVVSIERMILGLTALVTDADSNMDGNVDMGDVVRAERTILLGQ